MAIRIALNLVADSINVAISSSTGILRCPKCRSSLALGVSTLECGHGHSFLIQDGVICFRPDLDPFYEGRYSRHVRHLPGSNPVRDWAFFNLAQGGVFGDLRREIRRGAFVLDLGCAGGIRWLGQHALSIGVDVSLESLKVAAPYYELALQASGSELPLEDGSVDVAYSSFLFEHLSSDIKDATLGEIHRVLKPGGRLIAQFDTLSRNRLMTLARRDQVAYRKAFIEHDQHYGLEPLTEFFRRLERRKLRLVRSVKFGTTWLQFPPVYQWLADGYGSRSLWIRALGATFQRLPGPLRQAYEGITTAFYRSANRLTNPDMATGAIVTAEKTA